MTDKELALKLKTDPRFFIETFLWLVDKGQKSSRFKFNSPQERYYGSRTSADLILKARKEGFSTLIEALFLHACIFQDNVNAVTMAHTWDDTVIHLNRVKYFLDNMGGKKIKVDVPRDKDNQREIYFPHSNSRYWIGTAGSRAFGRGRDITHLHLSEVAHYEDQAVLTSVLEACVPGATKVLETTANGLEAFYRMWQDAGDPGSGSPWRRHFFSWFEDPMNSTSIPVGVSFRPTSEESRMQKAYGIKNEQLNWWRMKRSETPDKTKMPQEYPSNAKEAFLASGRPVFDMVKLDEIEKSIKAAKPAEIGDLQDDGRMIDFKASDEGYLSVYRFPRQGRQYLIGADVAEGIQDGDWSVAHILDRSSWEEVAVWRGRTDPGSFGKVLCDLGYFFNNAVLAPELNNHGWATVERIKSEQYPHLLSTKEIWPDDTPRDGFPVLNQKIKGMVITALRNAVNDRTVPIHHMVTVQEMQTFIEDKGQMQAQKDCHDDCVTSLAIGVYCLKFLSVEETYAERVPRVGVTGFGRREPESAHRRNRAGY